MEYVTRNVSGASITTMRCGGSVDLLARPNDATQLETAITQAKGVPIKVLGGGSNLILSEQGFQGMLLQPTFRNIQIAEISVERLPSSISQPRYASGTGYLNLDDETEIVSDETVFFKAGCDVPWGMLVQWSLQRQLHGLHRYARIPCRVGGAVYNNIHAQQHLLQECVYGVEALCLNTNERRWYEANNLGFGYDRSRFHQSNELITSVIFALPKVSNEQSALDASQYRDWTAQKAQVQPSGPNSGSIFKNLSPEVAYDGHVAAGWYVEQCGFKGASLGGMQVFEGHANFIVNTGEGTQTQLIELIERIRKVVHEHFQITLEPEVECVDLLGGRHQWS